MTDGPPGLPMAVTIDLRSPVPPFEQIRAQIAAHLSAGALRPGDRLPTIRALAADLGVAVGTVSRAYRELELTGAVTSRRRTGTVVSDGAPGTTDRPTPVAVGGTSHPARTTASRSIEGEPSAQAVTATGAPGGGGGTRLGTAQDRADPKGGAFGEETSPLLRTPPSEAARTGERRATTPLPRDSAVASGDVSGLVAAADALAAAAVAAGADDREVLTLVSGALLLARRP